MRRLLVMVMAVSMVTMAMPLIGSAARPAEIARETHCVMDVVSQLDDGELVMGPERCYETFSEAMLDASGGAVALSHSTKGSVLFTDDAVMAAMSSFTLGTHYSLYWGLGSSITIVGTSCTGGYWNTSSSWDNRISSSYNGCGVLRHYNYANLVGSSQSTSGAGTTDNLSTLNNKAESISYN